MIFLSEANGLVRDSPTHAILLANVQTFIDHWEQTIIGKLGTPPTVSTTASRQANLLPSLLLTKQNNASEQHLVN